MKKRLSLIFSSLALLLVMIVTFCACSTYGSVKSAYKKAGWEETEISDTYKKAVTDMFGEEAAETLTIHVLKKKVTDDMSPTEKAEASLSYVVIAEFKSTKEMEEQMKKHVTAEDAKELAEKIQKLPNVSGNCVYVAGTMKANEIFQSTKK